MAAGAGSGRLVPPMNAPPGGLMTPGVQPGTSQAVVIANRVIIQGAGGGEFIYDASGNLRSANVGATTKDPIKHITCQQGFSTFNGHGAVISLNATALDAVLLYADTGTSSQGALISSDASAAVTDPFGNAVLAGRTGYRLIGGVFFAVNENPTAGFSAGVISFYSAAAAAGPWTAQGLIGANNIGNLWLQTQDGSKLELDQTGILTLNKPAAGPAQFNILNGTGQNTYQSDPSGIPEVINGNDLRTYAVGQSLGIVGTNTLINSTTPINLVTIATVGAGTYQVRGRVRFTSATGTIQPMSLRFIGNATMSSMEISTTLVQETTGSALQPGVITAQNTDPSVSPNLGNSSTYRWEFDGIIRVSASGSFILAARQGTSSLDETFTVTANSWMEIQPTV